MTDSDRQLPEDEVPIVARVVGDTSDSASAELETRASAEAPSLHPAGFDDTASDRQTASQQSELQREAGNPFVATGKDVRTGSPFAVDPVGLWDDFLPGETDSATEVLYDVGPLKYTAIGAVAASIMVIGFAGAASWWFPGGGTLIAGLGCALAIFGLYSPRKSLAGACLLIHLCLFLLCYGRVMMI